MPEEKSNLVYSTDRIIPRKEKPVKESVRQAPNPSQQKTAQKAPHKVIVRLDRRQRGGKSVTVIEGLIIPANEMEALLKRLKAGLGTGGTIKDSSLEIQGDHCNAVIAALTDMGFRPKRSGC